LHRRKRGAPGAAKGHLYLLEAVARLLPDWPRIHCVIVGEGRSYKKLLQHAENLGLNDHVYIIGFRDDIPQVVRGLRYLCPAVADRGNPVCLVRGLYLRKAGRRQSGWWCPEIIIDGQNGRLVEPGDVAGLALAIDALLSDRKLAGRLGEQAELDIGRAL